MSGPIELPVLPTALGPAPDEPARAVDGRRFRVEGMDCAACAKTVEKTVAALDGVTGAQVSFGTATMVVAG
jgi:Cd2+/Zn2+-exporting ATPase